MCTGVYEAVCMHFLALPTERSEISDSPIAISVLAFLASKYQFHFKDPGFLEKWENTK